MTGWGLPPLSLPHRVSDRPRSVGQLDFPHETEVHRKELQAAHDAVPGVYEEVRREFRDAFGRELAPALVPYRIEDAEHVLVSMGTTASTVRAVVDEARAEGIRVGAVRIRMFRPFPEEALRGLLARATRVGVIDRDLCPGQGGIVWSEVRPAAAPGAIVQGYMAGLGGGDVRPVHVRGMLDDLRSRARAEAPRFVEVG